MRVQHNIASMNAYRNYKNNASTINRNIEKLSSGYKINRAGDDAAGLAISEKMRAQITGLEGAQKNAKDGISLVQTAEGALTEVHSMLNRMYSLAEQSANGTYDNNTDRAQLQKEVSALRTEIDRIADSANFNGLKLLDGSMSKYALDESYAEETGFQDYLQSYLQVSMTGDADDFDRMMLPFINDGSGCFDAMVDVGDDGKLSAGDTITFLMATYPTDGEFIVPPFNVEVFDSAGNKLPYQIAEGDDQGVLTFGDTGEAFAYDGDHQVTFHYTNSAGQSVGTITYRFDRTDFTPQSGNDDYGCIVSFKDPSLSETQAAHSRLKLQIGDDANAWNIMTLDIGDTHSKAMGISNVDISEQGSAQVAMNALKTAINYVSDIRGGLGATQNRLEHTINNLSVMQENIQDAESTIRDTDVADEMMKYTKNSILVQSAQAMLAQANQQPQGVLQLLQ